MKIKEFIKSRFGKTVISAILLVFAFAAFDVFVMFSGLFGTAEQYTLGQFPFQWWNIYKTIVLFEIISIGITYFFLIKKDWSESLAISAIPFTLWKFGLADVLYFWMQLKNVPSELPWLNNAEPIHFISSKLGYATVTNVSLFISVLIGIGITWLIVYILKEKI